MHCRMRYCARSCVVAYICMTYVSVARLSPTTLSPANLRYAAKVIASCSPSGGAVMKKKKLGVSNTPYDGGWWVTDGGWWVTGGGWWVTNGSWRVTAGDNMRT